MSVSYTGAQGSFNRAPNDKLQAIQVLDITSSPSKGIFYLATADGAAYSTAYLNSAVTPFDKWNSPYGIFPIDSINGTITAIAVNPYDSLNVVAGYMFLFVSKTGPNGFTDIMFPYADSIHHITDIAFASNNIAIITAYKKQAGTGGFILRSTDKGLTWTNVSPANLNRANTIEVVTNSTDTIIYIGTGDMGVNGSFVNEAGQLWMSKDMGLTWTLMNYGPHSSQDTTVIALPINDIAAVKGSSDSLYLVAGNQQYSAFVFSANLGINYEYISFPDSFILIYPPNSNLQNLKYDVMSLSLNLHD